MAGFPELRLRRLRRTQGLRGLVQETRLTPQEFVFPLFLVPGRGQCQEIESMPGICRLSPDLAAKEAEEVASLGIPALLLFGIPSKKDEFGSEAYHPQGVIQEALREIKKAVPELVLITDVCLCEYTSHGHCGVFSGGEVDNDKTLDLLARTALSQAQAGADVVAPSAMMDGQVAAIRERLDQEGFSHTPILAYAAKYSSCFYSPFREAAESTPQSGNRRGYQMDPANVREALREVEQDLLEGADLIMVKPALAYLDVLHQMRDAFPYPVAAYNVSGEYAMVKAASRLGWLEEKRATLEVLTAIKRAGADILITYHAKEAARWLKEG